MTTPEAVGLSSERLARVRPAVEKYVGEDKIAGAVTLIARRGYQIDIRNLSNGKCGVCGSENNIVTS